MEAFQKFLPAGTMNFVSGRGRDTMPVLMETGKVDSLAFIGGSSAADSLIRQHPYPHRLKIFLQLEAKNMGIFLPDMFGKGSERVEELSKAVEQSVLGGKKFSKFIFYLRLILLMQSTHYLKNANILHSIKFQWTTMYFPQAFLHSERTWG